MWGWRRGACSSASTSVSSISDDESGRSARARAPSQSAACHSLPPSCSCTAGCMKRHACSSTVECAEPEREAGGEQGRRGVAHMCHSRCSSSTGLDALQCPQPHSYQDASDKYLRRVSAALIFAHCRCSVHVTEGLGGGVAPAVNTRAPCACNGGISRVCREWSCVRTRWKRKQRCALSSSVETIESSPLSSSPSRRLRQYSSGRLGRCVLSVANRIAAHRNRVCL